MHRLFTILVRLYKTKIKQKEINSISIFKIGKPLVLNTLYKFREYHFIIIIYLWQNISRLNE